MDLTDLARITTAANDNDDLDGARGIIWSALIGAVLIAIAAVITVAS